MTREQFAALLRAMCERYNIYPRTAALLWRWARTEEGVRFANGMSLIPLRDQNRPRKAKPKRKPRQYGKSLGMVVFDEVSLDWIEQ